MREIHIAAVISAKRKERGITQDELAEYIGVTKASVSKWETGQSYPDITLLPQLAAYFNISIDELIGYLPQMTSADIKKNYNRLAADFAVKPFHEVYEECQGLLKKYYSCFPFVFQMAALYMNHYRLAPSPEKQQEILGEVGVLCQHIKAGCGDIWLARQANSVEAVSYLIQQKPLEVLELLEGTLKPIQGDEEILASAYQMRGDMKKAKSVLQISIFQHIMSLAEFGSAYLSLFLGQPEKFDEAFARFAALGDAFKIEELRPDLMLKIYYVAALEYLGRQEEEKALEMLRLFARAATSANFAEVVLEDEFFDLLEEWVEEFDVNKKAPRDKKQIKEDVLRMVKGNPAFISLGENPAFRNILNKLEKNVELKEKK